ncbi:hypothetical protein DdX_21967 [Ditylenchus destructor]|uniref:Uncharacterized protein n=1 Tax=Ditylenchus destructor TaxID=166010 RepID=A0AAD4ME84_9BILA|nr:hypothetical protein DdX_21967 [Ditylenchus destructor]
MTVLFHVEMMGNCLISSPIVTMVFVVMTYSLLTGCSKKGKAKDDKPKTGQYMVLSFYASFYLCLIFLRID